MARQVMARWRLRRFKGNLRAQQMMHRLNSPRKVEWISERRTDSGKVVEVRAMLRIESNH